MIPRRVHANGLPWLDWISTGVWKCHNCGDSGRQPAFDTAGEFARWVGAVKRDHARCGDARIPGDGEVGDPRNLDRRAP